MPFGTLGNMPFVGDLDGDGISDLRFTGHPTIPGIAAPAAMARLPSASPGFRAIARFWAILMETAKRILDCSAPRRALGSPFEQYGTIIQRQFGSFGDVPVVGDFDGDGADDFAVYRPSTGQLYILLSSKYSSQFQWGRNHRLRGWWRRDAGRLAGGRVGAVKEYIYRNGTLIAIEN